MKFFFSSGWLKKAKEDFKDQSLLDDLQSSAEDCNSASLGSVGKIVVVNEHHPILRLSNLQRVKQDHESTKLESKYQFKCVLSAVEDKYEETALLHTNLYDDLSDKINKLNKDVDSQSGLIFDGAVVQILSYTYISSKQAMLDEEETLDTQLVLCIHSLNIVGEMQNVNDNSGASCTHAIADSTPLYRLGQLSLSFNKTTLWCVECLLVKKSEVKPFVRASDSVSSQVQRLQWRDASSQTEMAIFGSLCDQEAIKNMEIGHVYRIVTAKILPASLRFRQWPNEFGAHFDLQVTEKTRFIPVSESRAVADIINKDFERSQNERSLVDVNDDFNNSNNSNNNNNSFRMKRINSNNDIIKSDHVSATSGSLGGFLYTNTSKKLKKEIHVIKNSSLAKTTSGGDRQPTDSIHHQNASKSRLLFTPLDSLMCQCVNSLHNIIVCLLAWSPSCKEVYPTSRKKSRGALSLRHLFVVDYTGTIVRVALWGEEAEKFNRDHDLKRGAIMLFKEIQLTNFGGFSLSVRKNTSTDVIDSAPRDIGTDANNLPECSIPEINKLRLWWSLNEKDIKTPEID